MWFIAILLSLFTIIVYLHIYVHFRVSPENYLEQLDDVCKKNITDMAYYKNPFVFKCLTMVREINLEKGIKLDTKGKCSIYSMVYQSIPLLEPSVKFFPKVAVYQFTKSGKTSEIERNLECRNFYIVQKGTARISCIHPKYSDHFMENIGIEFVRDNPQMIHIEMSPGDAVFVPNYWRVVIESKEKNTMIEKIQYSTILNQTNFLYEKYVVKGI